MTDNAARRREDLRYIEDHLHEGIVPLLHAIRALGRMERLGHDYLRGVAAMVRDADVGIRQAKQRLDALLFTLKAELPEDEEGRMDLAQTLGATDLERAAEEQRRRLEIEKAKARGRT